MMNKEITLKVKYIVIFIVLCFFVSFVGNFCCPTKALLKEIHSLKEEVYGLDQLRQVLVRELGKYPEQVGSLFCFYDEENGRMTMTFIAAEREDNDEEVSGSSVETAETN